MCIRDRFESSPTTMMVWGWVDRTDRMRIWFAEKPGFFDLRLWQGDVTGPGTRLDLPDDCSVHVHGDWLAVKRRSAWTIGDHAYPPDTLLGISLSRFLGGERNFARLFEPGV